VCPTSPAPPRVYPRPLGASARAAGERTARRGGPGVYHQTVAARLPRMPRSESAAGALGEGGRGSEALRSQGLVERWLQDQEAVALPPSIRRSIASLVGPHAQGSPPAQEQGDHRGNEDEQQQQQQEQHGEQGQALEQGEGAGEGAEECAEEEQAPGQGDQRGAARAHG